MIHWLNCVLVLSGLLHNTVLFGAVSRILIRIMLGLIWRLIGPANVRLLRYLKEAASLLMAPVEEKTLDKQEITIAELIKCMNVNICLLEWCSRDQASLLGISITIENHTLDIKLLTEKFDKKKPLLSHYVHGYRIYPGQEINLVTFNMYVMKLRRFLDSWKLKVNLLMNRKLSISKSFLNSTWRLLLSSRDQGQTGSLEESKDPWIMSSLKETIRRYISVHKNVHCYAFDNRGQSNNNNRGHVKSQPFIPKGKQWTEH